MTTCPACGVEMWNPKETAPETFAEDHGFDVSEVLLKRRETVDHIIPRSYPALKAPDSINTIRMCKRCNMEKGALLVPWWIEIRKRTGRPIPKRFADHLMFLHDESASWTIRYFVDLANKESGE